MTSKQIKTEIAAGLTTFFTMSYIVVVNPSILAAEGTGMSFSGVLTATVLVCFVMTLLMGLYAKLPFAIAPGMGINAFFTYTLVIGQGIPWQTALGMVFVSGIIFVLISLTPLREAIARAIPIELRIGAAAGIGIFLTFIGLRNAGLIQAHPATLVQFGQLNAQSLLALAGLALAAALLNRKNPFAFLAAILGVTLSAWGLGYIEAPQSWVSAPDFDSVFLKLDLMGALKLAFVPAIISLLFVDLFDSLSTFIGVAQAAGMTDEEGQPKNLRQGLIVDAFATLGSGIAGTSSGTTYIESASGIEVGGRIGLTSVAAALCFLPCLFLAPLAAMVPGYATAPVLILVGAFMFKSVTKLDLTRLEKTLPAYLTIILIPLTFSITQGILWGFISYTALHLLFGKGRQVSWMLYGLGLLSVILLAIEHGQ